MSWTYSKNKPYFEKADLLDILLYSIAGICIGIVVILFIFLIINTYHQYATIN